MYLVCSLRCVHALTVVGEVVSIPLTSRSMFPSLEISLLSVYLPRLHIEDIIIVYALQILLLLNSNIENLSSCTTCSQPVLFSVTKCIDYF